MEMIQVSKLSKCPIHKEELLKYYCTEEKCDKPVCARCLGKHNRHKVKQYLIAIEDKKKLEEKKKMEEKKKQAKK